MGSSSRPQPLSLDKESYMNTTGPLSPESAGSTSSHGYFGDYTAMPSPDSFEHDGQPIPRSFTASSKSSKKAKSKKVNAHSYCGRHSDEFLFSGLSDMWQKITRKD